MKIDDLMRDAVAPVDLDVHDLARTARARGTVRRRQRRLAVVLAGVGVAATVGAVGLVPHLTGHDGGTATTVASDAPSPAPTVAPDAPLTGRSTVAVLVDLVSRVGGEGTLDSFAGQGGSDPRGDRDTYGELHLTPPGEGLGVVGVNVQGRGTLDLVGESCTSYMVDCTVRRLPGGDLLRVYSDDYDNAGQRRVAELLSQRRGLRVVVGATNGLDLPSSRWEVTREGTVLDDEQLVAIATSDVWDFEVPVEYAVEGDLLAPYTDFDAASSAEPSALPTAEDAQPSADPSE